MLCIIRPLVVGTDLLLNVILSVFWALKVIFQVLAHLDISSSDLLRVALISWSELSSEYTLRCDKVALLRPLMYIKNCNGPRIDPCGTPVCRDLYSLPLIATH